MSSLNIQITSATDTVKPTLLPHFTPAPSNTEEASKNLTILFGILATLLTIAGLAIAMLQLLQIRHLGGSGILPATDTDLELGLMDAQQNDQDGEEDLHPTADEVIESVSQW